MTEPWQPYPAQPPQGQPYPAQPPAAPGWQQPVDPGYPAGQGYPAPSPGYASQPYPPNPGYPGLPGYPQPPYLPPPYPQGPGYGGAPVLSAKRSKLPYVIGAVLLVVGILGAIVGIVWGVSGSSDAVDGSSFASGESTTVTLQANEPKIIYVSRAERNPVNCHLSGDPAHITLTQYGGGLTVDRWEAVFTISADQTGEHTVTCRGAGDPTFTIGNDASTSIVALAVGIIVGGFIAFAGALVLLITFLMRRRNAPVALVPAPPYPYQ